MQPGWITDAATENERLRHENESLVREVESLKEQFVAAVKLSSEFDDVAAENSSHVETIQNMKDEVDSLKKRLQISLQSKVDLTETSAADLEHVRKEHEREVEAMKRDLAEQRENMLKREKDMKRMASAFETERNETAVTIGKAESELKRIYLFASEVFGETVEDVEHLVDRLAKVNEKHEEEEVELTVARPNEPSLEEREKCRKMKSIIKALKNENAAVGRDRDATIRRLKSEAESAENEWRLRVREVENRVDRLTEQCEELKRGKSGLIEENAKLQTKLKCTSVEAEAKRIEDGYESGNRLKALLGQLHEVEEKNDILRKQIQPLVAKVRTLHNSLVASDNALTEKCESEKVLSEDKMALTTELEEIKTERDGLRVQLTAINQRVHGLVETGRDYKEKIANATIENKRLNALSANTIGENQSLTADLELARKENAELTAVVEQQHLALQQSESVCLEQRQNVTKLTDDLRIAEKRLVVAAQPISEVGLIPLALESVENFPPDLAAIIADITKNSTMRTPSMMKHMFTIINEWYMAQIQRTQKQLQEKSDELFEWDNQYRVFAGSLARAFSNVECDFGTVLTDKTVLEKIDSYVKEMKVEIRNVREERESLHLGFLDLLVEIGADEPVTAKSEVCRLHRAISERDEAITALKGKIRSHRKLVKVKDAQHEETIKQLNEHIKDNDSEASTLRSTISELQIEIADLRSSKRGAVEQCEEKTREQSVHFEARLREADIRILKLADELKVAKSMHHKAEEAKVAADKRVDQLRNTVKLISSSSDAKDHEIEHLKGKITAVSDKARAKIGAHREIHERKSDSVVAEMQEKITELTLENARLVQTVTRLENADDHMRVENEDLALKLQAAEMRVESLSGDFERERRLLESQLKTQLRANEYDFATKLESVRVKLHEAKHGLIKYFAESFCTFFDFRDPLDESNFESFVSVIRGRFSALLLLESQLRELLGLGPKQSIQDCVSTLLLSVK